MDELIEKLKVNWEFGVAGAVLLITVLMLGGYFFFGKEDDLGELTSAGSMESSSMLSGGAFDFLTKNGVDVNGNPFKLPLTVPEPPKPKPKPQPQPKPKPRPVAEYVPEPVVEEQPRKPEFEKAIAQFIMKGSAAARPMAILKLTLPDGTVENVKMAIGDTSYGIKILAIDGEQLEVQDAKGVKGTMPRGKPIKLHLKR